jgi:hypothetical protein
MLSSVYRSSRLPLGCAAVCAAVCARRLGLGLGLRLRPRRLGLGLRLRLRLALRLRLRLRRWRHISPMRARCLGPMPAVPWPHICSACS